MSDRVAKLLSLASLPLSDATANVMCEASGVHPRLLGELHNLLRVKNGFFVFESALHVFPTEGVQALSEWNSPTLWRGDYGEFAEAGLFFAEDIFGGQFCMRGEGVHSFDPETGESEWMAGSIEAWARLVLEDFEFLTGHSMAHEWQVAHGPLPEGHRLRPNLPFVLGGNFDVANLSAVDAAVGMRQRAGLAVQIRDLPDGTKVELEVVE